MGYLVQVGLLGKIIIIIHIWNSVTIFSANTSTQTMGPRPAAAATAATPAVRTVPQYKYAAGVRNPQQHLNTQPQVAMQQVCDLGSCSVLLLMFFAEKVVRVMGGQFRFCIMAVK